MTNSAQQPTNKVSRRTFLRGAAFGLTGAALAACTVVAPPQATSSEEGASGSQAAATMTFAAGGVPSPFGPAFERQAQRFEEFWAAESGQSVVVEPILDPDWSAYHYQKLPTLVAAGTPPDVSWNSGVFVSAYVAKGDWVMVLNDYIERDKDVVDIENDFAPIVKQASMYQDDYICFAEAGMVYLITLFNKDFLAANNMPMPDELYANGEWTWEKLDEMAREMTQRDANDRPVQFGTTTSLYSGSWGFQARLWSYGADTYNEDESAYVLDSEEGYRQAEIVAKALCEDRVAPRAEDQDIDWLASQKLGIHSSFPTGIAGWMEKYEFAFDVAPLPSGPAGWIPSAAFDGWQIANATADPELAWQYVLFVVGPEEDMIRSTDWVRPPNHIANFETWATDLAAQGRIQNIDYLRESMLKARLAHLLAPEFPEYRSAYSNHFQTPLEGCLVSSKDAVDALSAEARKLIDARAA